MNKDGLLEVLVEAFNCYLTWRRQAGKKNLNGGDLDIEKAYAQIYQEIETYEELKEFYDKHKINFYSL